MRAERRPEAVRQAGPRGARRTPARARCRAPCRSCCTTAAGVARADVPRRTVRCPVRRDGAGGLRHARRRPHLPRRRRDARARRRAAHACRVAARTVRARVHALAARRIACRRAGAGRALARRGHPRARGPGRQRADRRAMVLHPPVAEVATDRLAASARAPVPTPRTGSRPPQRGCARQLRRQLRRRRRGARAARAAGCLPCVVVDPRRGVPRRARTSGRVGPRAVQSTRRKRTQSSPK